MTVNFDFLLQRQTSPAYCYPTFVCSLIFAEQTKYNKLVFFRDNLFCRILFLGLFSISSIVMDGKQSNCPTVTASDEPIVYLNVGGQHFDIARSTLEKYPDTFLCKLVNGNISSRKDRKGRLFIDRDPRHFNDILNYYRYDIMPTITSRPLAMDREFFGIANSPNRSASIHNA